MIGLRGCGQEAADRRSAAYAVNNMHTVHRKVAR
jgi:hypothetical protein